MLIRPQAGEYAKHFAPYIDEVPEGDLLAYLENQPKLLRQKWAGVSEEQANYRYAEGKWSVKEVLGHMTDTERIMSYRMLRIARGDSTPLPGFEEELFVRQAGFDRLSIEELLRGFEIVREATLALVRQLDAAAWTRMGTAAGEPASARSLAYNIAGHAQHHARILNERYMQEA
ncbi:DinB family protein [Paenibacillus phocaensis]|uniref:DinB family protein n=1 Tax=Paenibacillus phocaensis TaxID=1776378 RepID=UPI000839B24E|nr:DinB family protein [Paenibacillus phocaensis]